MTSNRLRPSTVVIRQTGSAGCMDDGMPWRGATTRRATVGVTGGNRTAMNNYAIVLTVGAREAVREMKRIMTGCH